MALNVEFTEKNGDKTTLVSLTANFDWTDAYLDLPEGADLTPASNTRRLNGLREAITDLLNPNLTFNVETDEGKVVPQEYRTAIAGYTANGELVFIPGSEVAKVRIFEV